VDTEAAENEMPKALRGARNGEEVILSSQVWGLGSDVSSSSGVPDVARPKRNLLHCVAYARKRMVAMIWQISRNNFTAEIAKYNAKLFKSDA